MTDTVQPPTTPQPVATVPPIEAVRLTLVKLEAEFARALPPQIPAQKFVRTTMTAIQMNPDLLGADRRSLLSACMKAAQDGLLVDGREAALVMFKNQVQYLPMIGGLLKKLRNSGELASIGAHVAYENDEFRFELGDEERIVHRPKIGDQGKPIAAYAIAKTKDGAVYREVMSVDQIEQVRSCSKAKDGPWVAWWAEMARKTVLRRLCKRLPSSADLDTLMQHDNETVDLSPQTTEAAPAVSRLRASISISDAVPATEEAAPAAKE